MVPANSCRIPRVPHYSGAVSFRLPISGTGLSPPAAVLSRTFPYLPASVIDGPITPATALTMPVWAPARSLATTYAITFVFFSSGYLDVSVPRVRLTLCVMPALLPAGCPIRISARLKVFASLRGFSQLITSFFASESQGILHVPLSPFLLSLGATPGFLRLCLALRFFF